MSRFLFSLIFIAGVAVAAPGSDASYQRHETTQSQATASSVAIKQDANYWSLSEKEWQRYETLMQSPLTYDMQSASPLEVLAQFARSEEERRRLAERLVEFDKARADGLLALNNAYTAAWKRLYPNLKPVGEALPERVALFVRKACDSCIDALKNWRQHGVSVDVYLVGDGKDEALQTWASNAGIRQQDVEQRYITLNHDNQGLWFRLAKGKAVPIAAAERGGQWVVVAQP